MKIVKFPNGKYGIRKGNWLFGYQYWHRNDCEWTRSVWIPHFIDTLEEARKIKSKINEKEVVVE